MSQSSERPSEPNLAQIILQGIAVATFGAVAIRTGRWLDAPDAGWAVAIVVWTVGYPAIEIARRMKRAIRRQKQNAAGH